MVDNPYKYPYVPVGGIIEWDGTGLTGAPDLSTPEKVAAVYGYGTWERYGIDRVTVGAGGDYTAGSVGGEKEHTLTVDEMPSHNHKTAKGEMSENADTQMDKHQTYQPEDGIKPGKYWYAGTLYTGGSRPHNNMPPYIGTYKYRRIA